MSNIVRYSGLGLLGMGLAHFAMPDAFEQLSAVAFPRDTRRHVYVDGAIETALGLGLLVPSTRRLASVGALGYVGYLGANVVKNQTA